MFNKQFIFVLFVVGIDFRMPYYSLQNILVTNSFFMEQMIIFNKSFFLQEIISKIQHYLIQNIFTFIHFILGISFLDMHPWSIILFTILIQDQQISNINRI